MPPRHAKAGVHLAPVREMPLSNRIRDRARFVRNASPALAALLGALVLQHGGERAQLACDAPQRGRQEVIRSHVVPRSGAHRCDVALTELDATLRNAPMGEAANRTYASLQATANDAECRMRMHAALKEAPCGTGLGLASAAMFGAATTRAEELIPYVNRARIRLGQGDGACVQALLPSVQGAGHVSDALVDAVGVLARSPSANARTAAWMTLGSLARAAYLSSDAGTYSRVQRSIYGALRDAPNDVVVIEAAGNAGCTICIPALRRALGARDPWVRRAAVSAFRFMASVAATHAMCDALSDPSNDVRTAAAWALHLAGQEAPDPETRGRCLLQAATRDLDEGVRLTAARSLSILASLFFPALRTSVEHLADVATPAVRAILPPERSEGRLPFIHEAPLEPAHL
jgi:hypothetical protein